MQIKIILTPTNTVIIEIIVIEKSWKKDSSSINGEALSWRDNMAHVGIFKKLKSYK